MSEDKQPDQQITELYQQLVGLKYPDKVMSWPVLSGYNSKIGIYNSWTIVIFEHTGNQVMRTYDFLGELSPSLVGSGQIDHANKNAVRVCLEKHFYLKANDAVVMVDSQGHINDELDIMLHKHEYAVGLTPMKIFLSHKGADKAMVREFKRTLEDIGFAPWLDEDAMSAGTELERGILQGFKDSCAAVFFVTPNFKDENYLASEVDYAIAEKRKKGERFAIITLVFNYNGQKGKVPDLLHRYVWKEPNNELEALREIIRALPVAVGSVYWKYP